MPVYNAELFLNKCIESVQNQKHKSWELILIDDCSTDKSFDLCMSYAAEDSRIKVLRNYNNQGVSYTRNKGIESAIGEYITFLDADDWFDVDFLSNSMNMCHAYQLDVYMSGYRRIESEDGIIRFSSSIPEVIKMMDDLPNERKMQMLIEHNYISSCCGNIIKKNMLGEHKFSQGMIWGEDLCFMMGLFDRPVNIIATSEIYYNYRIVESSLVSNVSKKKCDSFIKTYITLFEYGKKHGYNDGIYSEWIKKRMTYDYITIQKMILKSHKSIFSKYIMLRMLTSNVFIKKMLRKSSDKYVKMIATYPILVLMYNVYLHAKTKERS